MARQKKKTKKDDNQDAGQDEVATSAARQVNSVGQIKPTKREARKEAIKEALLHESTLRLVNLTMPAPSPRAADNAVSDGKYGWRLPHTEEQITGILQRGTMGELQLVPSGSNYTFIVPMRDEETATDLAVIYKPRKGEAPLWDFPSGTLYKREFAAYLVSRALNWNFIPPVVVREGDYGVGTVQLFVPTRNLQLYELREEFGAELQRIAIFDFITNNADRKAGHCLLGNDGHIWGIDHGLCFNHVPKLRTIIWDWAGEPISEVICTELANFATNSERLNALLAQLDEILDRSEVIAFVRRLEEVLNNPVFPQMVSRRQIPWEFY